MTRRCGRSPVGQRLVCAVPHGHYQTTTLLAAVRLQGPQAPWLFDGAMNGALFVAWVQQGLVPGLRRDDVVILDHLATHKAAGVREAIEGARGAAGIPAALFAGPQPDREPVEQGQSGAEESRTPDGPPVVQRRWRGLRHGPPPRTATASFCTPDTLHDKWKCSNCTLCKTQLRDATTETWTTPNGEALQVAQSATLSAVAETSVGEFEICEACYRRGLPERFTPQDMAEIHYQFGLGYSHSGQFGRSAESLKQARHISETADIVAALARAEDALGHRDMAIVHYRRALEIDPSHFMSLQNLQRIL